MSNDIIMAIFDKYLSNAFEGMQAISPESQAAREALEKFENKHHISAEERNDIEDNIITEVTKRTQRLCKRFQACRTSYVGSIQQ